jgi:hypothetical protein
MSEIVGFEEFTSTNQIVAQSAGLVRVVLEGQDDAKLFKTYWFTDYQARFEFIAADQIPGAAGGSAGVLTAVNLSRDQGIPAYGIIDRDTLFRTKCWAGLYELDAAALQHHALDADVYTTQFWEVEAYVLEEQRLRDWVEGNYVPPPASAQICATVLDKTLQECELLLKASPFFAALHVSGRTLQAGYFAGQTHLAILTACGEQLAEIDWHHQVIAVIVEERVDAVAAAAPADPGDRLAWFLRYVDTKRLFVRLRSALNLNGTASHWQLAVAMKRSGHRPQELQDYLDQLDARAA